MEGNRLREEEGKNKRKGNKEIRRSKGTTEGAEMIKHMRKERIKIKEIPSVERNNVPIYKSVLFCFYVVDLV